MTDGIYRLSRFEGFYSMNKNTKKSKKIYRKLKNKGIIGSIINFLFYILLLFFILYVVPYQTGIYLLDTKLHTENKEIAYMARMYEQGLNDGDSEIYDMLELEGRDFVITDSKGDTVYTFGNDTRGKLSGKVRTQILNEEFYIYQDGVRDFIKPGANGDIIVNTAHMDRWIMGTGTIEIDTYNDTEPQVFADLPVWIQYDINGGEQHLIGRADVYVDTRDLSHLVMILLFFLTIYIILVLSKFIGSILNFINKRVVLNYFTTDYSIRGHNNNYFLIAGDDLIKKRRNRNAHFGVVNFVFVNFRNYVVAHSLEAGEEMLRNIYLAIQEKLNQKNELIAHMNSSSFAIIMKENDEERIRERLNELIKELEHIDSEHKFSFQAGVCFIKERVDEDGNPIKRKDMDINIEYNNACAARSTLAESDESGIAFFGEELVNDQKWIDTVQSRQEQAIAGEEFVIYYQPKYNPRTNELSGAEGLIRWQFAPDELVSPYKFIPIFEKSGFITEIDHYMLEHVARDQSRWYNEGYKCVPVSVNISRAHFIESDLAEQIRDTVDKYQTPHNLIEIELTESAFFDDKKAMLETIKKLKSYGFSVSMDDFGSGYSSLNSLKDMPLDVLKLDAEFFHSSSEDAERGEIVVSEAIKLAKSLNMKTVAEGVEIKEQVDFLAEEGCDMIQGYYYAKPMPGSDYETRMSKIN